MNRAHNFSAGPSTLPQSVIEELASEMSEFQESGMSLIEMSHRGKHYSEVHMETIDTLKRICAVPDDFEILLLQGGATLQFAMVPFNYDLKNNTGGYLVTGTWSQKAIKDAQKIGNTSLGWSGEESGFIATPASSEIQFDGQPKYIHLTSNETINGVRYPALDKLEAPLVIDMSSEFLARQIPWEHTDIVYGGAQKNIGPAGVCVVIVRKSVLEQNQSDIPAYLSYATHAKGSSMANTPPMFSIWATSKMLTWIENNGGIEAMENQAKQRAQKLYELVDTSNEFYRNPVEPLHRSLTNVVFRLETEELEKEFLVDAEKENLLNLKGHRSVGGIRASIYNGLPQASFDKLIEFMDKFASRMS